MMPAPAGSPTIWTGRLIVEPAGGGSARSFWALPLAARDLAIAGGVISQHRCAVGPDRDDQGHERLGARRPRVRGAGGSGACRLALIRSSTRSPPVKVVIVAPVSGAQG